MNERKNGTPAQRYEYIFDAAMALYAVLKTSGSIRLKRAEMHQGECEALPIDYCADIEVYAPTACTCYGDTLLWALVLQSPDTYVNLPRYLKLSMGNVFNLAQLGPDGDYRRLFYRVKQDSDRQAIINAIAQKEEETDGLYFAGTDDRLGNTDETV